MLSSAIAIPLKKVYKLKAVDKSQIDYYCIYCPETDQCYYLKPTDFDKSVQLRVTETKNNQSSRVKYATNYLNIE